MNLRTVILAVAAAATFATTASADKGKRDQDEQAGRHINGYVQCLRTDKIRFHGTIVEAALATPELSTLAFAVQAAGLVDVLSSPGPFTVFAPLNEAFAAVPEPVLSALLADQDLLTAVLTYHVSAGQGRFLDPRRTLFVPRERNTVQGQTVFFNRGNDGEPQVNQSAVSCQAVQTDNGTVWLIDSVLLPQF